MNNQNQSIDVFALLGILLAMQNLGENKEQTDMLNDHLHEQDGKYLKTIVEQNKIMIVQNEKIIKMLGGE